MWLESCKRRKFSTLGFGPRYPTKVVLQVFSVMNLYNQTSEPEVKGIVNISQQQAEDNFQHMQKFEQKQIHSIVHKNATLRTEKENLYKNP